MSIDNRAKSYGTIWADWTIGDEIGRGSGGKTIVYKLSRVNSGFVENDVLKVVNIIEDIGLEEMTPEYRDEYLKREDECIKKAEQEVNMMHLLQNSSNIVTYQDFKVNKMREEHFTAVDLLIRMHRYEDLSSIIKRQKNLTEDEVIDVAYDMCIALGECKKQGIVHRDIKPENIFYVDKKYLLGDFGISRILETGDVAQTSKGTKPYAAPEQFGMDGENGGYDHRVDIYSLGITLYKLANKSKLPFVNEYGSINNAIVMRLSGNPIPPIDDVSPELNNVILKACQFKPEDRYQDITDMLEDIQEIRKNNRKKKLGNEQDLEPAKESVINDKNDAADVYMTEPIGKQEVSADMYMTEPIGKQEVPQDAYMTEPIGKQEVTVNEFVPETAYKEPAFFNPEVNDIPDDAVPAEAAIVQKPQVEANFGSLSDCFVNTNRDQAVNNFRQMVQSGNADNVLNEMSQYFSDSVIARSGAGDAVFWYERFMEFCKDTWTISLAEYRLGDIYSKGIGVKRNHKIAEKYFASSAAKGNPYAKKKFVAGKYIK